MKGFFPAVAVHSWLKCVSILLLSIAIAGCGGDQSTDPTWSAAQSLDAGSVGEPKAVATRSGRVYVAWGRSSLFIDSPYVAPGLPTTVRLFNPSAGWQPSVQIGPTSPAKGDSSHQIAANETGAVVVAWTEYDFVAGTPRVMVNRFSPSTGWSGAMPIDPDYSSIEPRVVLDAGGTATVAWERLTTTDAALMSASSSGDTSAWSAATEHTGGLRHHELAMGASERPMLVFTGKNASGMLVTSATRRLSSGGWSAPEDLSTPTADQTWPCSTDPCPYAGDASLQLAANGSGVLTATWESLDVSTFTILVWTRIYTSSEGWAPATSIAEEYFFTTAYAQPSAIIDGTGNVLVLWRSVGNSNGAAGQLKMRRHLVGSGWQPTTTESRFAGRLKYSDIAVAPTPDGGFFLAWNETSPLVAHWSSASGWGDFHVLGSNNNTQTPTDGKVSIATDSAGAATATWLHVGADGKSGTVFVSRFE